MLKELNDQTYYIRTPNQRTKENLKIKNLKLYGIRYNFYFCKDWNREFPKGVCGYLSIGWWYGWPIWIIKGKLNEYDGRLDGVLLCFPDSLLGHLLTDFDETFWVYRADPEMVQRHIFDFRFYPQTGSELFFINRLFKNIQIER